MPSPVRTLLLLILAIPPQAHAEVFRVGSDVHCTHATLAAALAAAAANGPGHDEIRLTVGVQTTQARFHIEHTDVLIAGGYTACGVVSPGAGAHSLVVGNGHDSVFYIGNGRQVELRQLAITNGGRHGIANGDFAVGGGLWLNGGVAVLRGVRVMYNRARLGGGLAATGNSVLVIHGGAQRSEIDHNEAMLGGGIYVGERATVRIGNDNVHVVHNAANGSPTAWENAGGGIYATGGAGSASSVEVGWLDVDPDLPMPVPRGFLLADNLSTGNGGGIALNGAASFNATEATIRDNVAGGSGGGLYLYGNQVGAGASAQMNRRLTFLPAWLRNCEGRYGCNALTGNVARTGGAVMVMHGQLRLGQLLVAGNRSTDGGGAAIHSGSIANVAAPVNRIWLDSMVLAGNQCTGTASTHSPCATLFLGAGPNQVHMQHLTLADNVLASVGSAGSRYEIYYGPSALPLVLRSSIVEPAAGVTPVFSVAPVDGDCLMAPPFSGIGTRALPRTPPYAFVSRAALDYRPAAGDAAIDACDTGQLLDSGMGGPDLVGHGSVDDPTVPNRLGPNARADIGAFEKEVSDVIFENGFGG
ncbi:MAG: hypothetical protein KF823_01110 [Xanthomonadales bacterium]|nr:hypothetical protein [Xanthomonadales bacterium]